VNPPSPLISIFLTENEIQFFFFSFLLSQVTQELFIKLRKIVNKTLMSKIVELHVKLGQNKALSF
jgi:hypothetical protein